MMKALCIWLSLIGAPLAWLAQVMLSEMLSSYACYPHRVPLTAPLWQRLPLGIAGIDAICLAVAILSCAVTWQAWRRAECRLPSGEHAIEGGETRDAFLIMLGALSNAIFLVAILFTTCAILIVSPCHGWSR